VGGEMSSILWKMRGGGEGGGCLGGWVLWSK